ncbi:hypothetical protein [Candidatus Poriferisocius sp.]|uniref:hypothetical protein n=1 Tax=Candidatus Poriferisocius sp. TaxID=3101276 RepID=UPI003B0276A6
MGKGDVTPSGGDDEADSQQAVAVDTGVAGVDSESSGDVGQLRLARSAGEVLPASVNQPR